MVNVPLPSNVTVSFGVLVGSAGSTNLRLVTVAFVDSAGIVKVGVPSWVSPWIFFVVFPSGVTVNSVTVGTYFFVTIFPFSSSTWTFTPSAVPW